MSIFTLLGKGGEKNDCLFQLPNISLGIGTDPNKCSIVYLNGKGDISAFHCQLVPKQGFWTLTDYSDKGTWLNGKKITPFQAYRLKEGDVFYLATLENSFYFAEDKTANQGQLDQTQWQVLNQGQPSVIQSIETGVKEKFLTSNGRLDRKTYIIRGFYLTALNAIIWFFLGVILLTVPKVNIEIIITLVTLALLAMIVPGIMLSIRRLHDLDRSGWFLLANIVPIVGWLYLSYLLLTKGGTYGTNRFGAEYHYQTPIDLTQRDFEEQFLTFEGRLNRKSFIRLGLSIFGISFVIALVAVLTLSLMGGVKEDIQFITQIIIMPITYPLPLISIRRLHDLDKSGWFYLIMLIPIVNLLFIVYLLIAKGTTGANRFGTVPLT